MNEEFLKLKYTKDAALRANKSAKLSYLSSCESLMDWERMESLSASEMERVQGLFTEKFRNAVTAQREIEKEIAKGVNQNDKLPEKEIIRGK